MSSFFRFLPGWLLFIAWGILILWLSMIPSPPVIEIGFLGWDKFQHAFAYGVFTLLACRAFIYSPVSVKRRWRRAIMATATFGGLSEVAQGALTQTRTAELGDLLADIIGAWIVYCVMMMGVKK